MRRAVVLSALLLTAADAVAAPAPLAKCDRRVDRLAPFQGWWSARLSLGANYGLLPGMRVVVSGHHLRCLDGDKPVPDQDATLYVESRTAPGEGRMTLYTRDGPRWGVYQFDGDVLVIRTAAPGKPRSELYAGLEEGEAYVVLRRAPSRVP